MTRNIVVYIEGGGDSQATKQLLRQGFAAFFRTADSIGRNRGVRIVPVMCGTRSRAYNAFLDAMENEPESHNLLLVDSEAFVPIASSASSHLSESDGWVSLPEIGDHHCHLMVACTEAWFLADPRGLKLHFGGRMSSKHLPAGPQVESLTVLQVLNALKRAAAPTKARTYEKIRDASRLLQKIDPTEVRRHCKWCDRLFAELGSAIGGEV